MSFKHQPKLGESDVVKKSCEVEERNCIADQVDAEAAKMPAEVPLEAERGHPVERVVGPVGSAMVCMLEKTGKKNTSGF